MHDVDQLGGLAESFHADVGLFAVREREGVIAVVDQRRRAGWSAEWHAVLGTAYRRGEHLPGRVWEAKQGILIPDVDARALSAVALPQALPIVRNIRTLMMQPLFRGPDVVGLLAVFRDEPPAFTEEDFETLAEWAARHTVVGEELVVLPEGLARLTG